MTQKIFSYYLYAIVSGSPRIDYGDCGIKEGKVHAISNGKLTAVVSQLKDNRIRPERRNIKAHHQVLSMLMKETTPIPFAFGIIASSLDDIKIILTKNQDALIEQLAVIEDKMEMNLRVTCNVPNIFQFFIDSHPELKNFRDKILSGNKKASQNDKIELGQMFDRTLNSDREKHTTTVEEVLLPYCHEIIRKKCNDEKLLMTLAFLVDKSREKEFEKMILEAAGHFDNNYSFDYSGPWVPHSFIDVDIDF